MTTCCHRMVEDHDDLLSILAGDEGGINQDTSVAKSLLVTAQSLRSSVHSWITAHSAASNDSPTAPEEGDIQNEHSWSSVLEATLSVVATPK